MRDVKVGPVYTPSPKIFASSEIEVLLISTILISVQKPSRKLQNLL